MKYSIVVTQTAQEDIDGLGARWKTPIFQAMRKHLEHEPKKESKSRIKKMRGLRQPQYRLRVEGLRIYYDVDDQDQRVEVLGITLKERSFDWLSQHGVPE